MPNLYEVLLLIYDHLDLTDYEETMAFIWEQVRKETIDYGVMEKADWIAVLPASIGWVYVGSW